MEKSERELIRTRMTSLTNHTRCTPQFLMFFFEKKILSFDEIQEIAAVKVDSSKAFKFYMIIQTRTNGFTVLKEGLEKHKQSGALNILTGNIISEPTLQEFRITNVPLEQKYYASHKRNIVFDVLPPVCSFVGRKKELKELHQLIFRNIGMERVAIGSFWTCVSGLGGIGKTQLAREYVRLNAAEFDGNVLWMNAESESSLTKSFKKLANMLNLSVNDGSGQIPAKRIAVAVYKYFEGSKALFVFDNAEKAPWLKQFMPRDQTLFVLITSTEMEWDGIMEVRQLNGLLEDDAVYLIQKDLQIKKDQMESIRMLAQTLQCYPLALQQAIAYINEQKITSVYTINNYLGEFKSKHHQLLAFKKEDQLFDERFTSTTATTWSITFDKIKNEQNIGPIANLILNVVAYLGAENIYREMFYRIPEACTDPQFCCVNEEQVNSAVRLLVKYSMLNGRENQSVLNVHRLVQSVTQNLLARNGVEEKYLEIALRLLQGKNPDDFPPENIGHALIAWRHAFSQEKGIQRCSRQVVSILWKMWEVGYHDEGMRFGKEAVEKFKKVFGEDQRYCLITQRILGLILRNQGYYEKAASIFKNILVKDISTCTKENEFFLCTKEDLGITFVKNGNYKEAQKVLKDALEKRRTIFGENHPTTLTTEQNYGVLLLEIGNWTEAVEIFDRIKIYGEKVGGNSVKALELQNEFACVYSKKGNHEKAVKIHTEVYQKLSSSVNVDFFALVCSNLGESLNKVGKYEEALKVLEGNIKKIIDRLGSQHLKVLKIQKEIGKSYRGLGNFAKALVAFQSVHKGFTSVSGEGSVYALFAGSNVAVTLCQLGRHSEAFGKIGEILPKLEAHLGRDHLGVVNTKWAFARAVEMSGANLHTALNMLQSVRASLVFIGGEGSTNIKEVTNDIKRIEMNIQSNLVHNTKTPVPN